MTSNTDRAAYDSKTYDGGTAYWGKGKNYDIPLTNVLTAAINYGLMAAYLRTTSAGADYATLAIDYITVTVPDSAYYDFPTIVSPTGNITKGGIYRLTWSVSEQDATETGETLQYRASGTTDATSVDLSAGTRYYDLDTSAIAGTTGMEWRVGVTSSGVINWTDWKSNAFSQPSVSLTDIYPTGSAYRGFSQVYRWALSYSTPSDAIGTNISQASAELRYRAAGATDYSKIAISDSTTNYTMAGDVLPVGSVEWQVAVTTNCGYVYTSSWTTITNTELPITIDNLYPGSDGHAVKSVVNRFGWTFTVDDTSAPVTGYARQASAILYWRSIGSGDYTAVNISDGTQYYDMPAGTFTTDAIDWYVKVTANTGTEATSSVVTVSTLDTISTPACVSPSGVYVDDTSGATFTWRHINATGTAQTAWELSYSQDGGVSYTVLASGTDAASTYKSAAKAFSIGTLYWRVRTKNQDGAWGSYATPAIVIIQRAPDAPKITYSDTKPLPAIKWQSEAQIGYEIEVDGVSLGMVYGTEKQWQSSSVLSDDQHTIRLRIANVLEDVSPWASITVNTDNVPNGSVDSVAAAAFAQVSIDYSLHMTPTAAYLLRDGALASKLSGWVKKTATASGNPLTLAMADNGITALRVNGLTTQAGSGTPTPANVRAISGAGFDAAYTPTAASTVTALTSVMRIAIVIPNSKSAASTDFVCSSAPLRKISYSADYEHAYMQSGSLWLFAEKSKLSSYDVAGANAYLAANPTTVWYKSKSSATATTCYLVAERTDATGYHAYAVQTTAPLFTGDYADIVSGAVHRQTGYISSYAGETLPGTWISDRDVYSAGATPTTGAQVVYQLAAATDTTVTGNTITNAAGDVAVSAGGTMDVTYTAGYTGTAVDRATVGSHSYVVRAFTADGYYTDSPAVQAAPRVPYGAIGLLDGTGWVALKWTAGKDYISIARSAAYGALLRYVGRKYPVYDGDDDAADEALTAAYVWRDIDVSALDALIGKTVVYKDFRGNCMTGVYTSLPQQQHGSDHTVVTLAVTRTEQEVLTYDPI